MPATDRSSVIDSARGVAIVAIVLGHVLRGLVESSIISPSSASAARADQVLYLFHLATFALLSGLFVARSVARRGSGPYVRDRTLTFLYLYILWSLLQGSVKLVSASLVNSPTSVRSVLALWTPDAQLWFLPFLIVMTAVAVVASPWHGVARTTICMVVAAIVSVAAWGRAGPYVGEQGWALLMFYMAGCALGGRRLSDIADRLPMWLCAGLVLGGGAVVWFVSDGSVAPTLDQRPRDLASVSGGVAGAVAGTVAVIGLATLLSRTPWAAWVNFVGARSLEIFLAHITAAAGIRIALSRLGFDSAVIHVSAGLAVGLLAPIVLWWACSRMALPGLFDRPRRSTGTA